jgi:hypothetical protein
MSTLDLDRLKEELIAKRKELLEAMKSSEVTLWAAGRKDPVTGKKSPDVNIKCESIQELKNILVDIELKRLDNL